MLLVIVGIRGESFLKTPQDVWRSSSRRSRSLFEVLNQTLFARRLVVLFSFNNIWILEKQKITGNELRRCYVLLCMSLKNKCIFVFFCFFFDEFMKCCWRSWAVSFPVRVQPWSWAWTTQEDGSLLQLSHWPQRTQCRYLVTLYSKHQTSCFCIHYFEGKDISLPSLSIGAVYS